MLPGNARLTRALIEESFKNKVFFTKSPFFTLRTSPLSVGGRSRFGVSVSKKELKTAVLRNRARRRMYAILNEFRGSVRDGHAVLLSLKKETATTSLDRLREEVKKSLGAGGLLNPKP